MIFSVAVQDGKSRRKKKRLLSALTVSTVTLFLLVNSLVGSLKNGIESIAYKSYGRVVSFEADYKDYEGEMERLKAGYENTEAVGQVFWYTSNAPATWKGSDLVGVPSEEVELRTYLVDFDQYISEGKGQPEQGQIVVPKYLYNMGIYSQYNCTDGAELLGETLTFRVHSDYSEEEKSREYQFEVVGVIDNIAADAPADYFYLNEQDVLEMDKYRYYLSEECMQVEMLEMEMYGELDEETYQRTYELLYWEPRIGFFISPEYDLDEMIVTLREELGKDVIWDTKPAQSLVDYYDFIIYLGNVIVVMLGITVAVVLAVTILRDIRERKGQFALRYACGYSRSTQCLAYIIEQMLLLGRACLVSVAVTAVVLAAGNHVMNHIVPFYMRNIHMQIPWNTAWMAVAAVCCGSVFCVVVSAPGILRMRVAETLKQEEGR